MNKLLVYSLCFLSKCRSKMKKKYYKTRHRGLTSLLSLFGAIDSQTSANKLSAYASPNMACVYRFLRLNGANRGQNGQQTSCVDHVIVVNVSLWWRSPAAVDEILDSCILGDVITPIRVGSATPAAI